MSGRWLFVGDDLARPSNRRPFPGRVANSVDVDRRSMTGCGPSRERIGSGKTLAAIEFEHVPRRVAEKHQGFDAVARPVVRGRDLALGEPRFHSHELVGPDREGDVRIFRARLHERRPLRPEADVYPAEPYLGEDRRQDAQLSAQDVDEETKRLVEIATGDADVIELSERDGSEWLRGLRRRFIDRSVHEHPSDLTIDAPSPRGGSTLSVRQLAQQDSFATSLLKPRAASFSPSTVVR